MTGDKIHLPLDQIFLLLSEMLTRSLARSYSYGDPNKIVTGLFLAFLRSEERVGPPGCPRFWPGVIVRDASTIQR